MQIVFLVNTWPACLDSDFEGRGLGGAEAALVLLSRELVTAGHNVLIFNQARFSGVLNGVRYQNLAKLDPEEEFEILVLTKFPFHGFENLKAKRKIFWSLDLLRSDWDRTIFPFIDKVICMSPFHREFLLNTYKQIDSPSVHIMALGVCAEDYFEFDLANPQKEKGMRLIYCSMPDRGLEHLARIFPRIKSEVPGAELLITSDFSLWQRPPGTSDYKALFDGMDGVNYFGKVPRLELAALQKAAKVMAYPCTFPEGFCLSALECIAAGAVPVTTKDFALTSTVAENGILLDGKPGEPGYDSAFVEETVRLLSDKDYYQQFAQKGRERVINEFTWTEIAKRFELVISTI